MRVAGLELTDRRPVAGGDICRSWKAFVDGKAVFVKTLDGAPSGFFAAEARGLDLLRTEGGPALPWVIAAADDGLALEWIETGSPTRAAARRFGRRLAVLHQATLPRFGAEGDGFIGPLPLANAPADTWGSFYVTRRLLPYADALSPAQRHIVEELCARIDDLAGPAEPPARIHGDLWSGNLVWGADGGVWLVDAASAHGGHRETDLAMLRLFGAPFLDEIVSAYQEVSPLAAGWERRIPLHQMHPLLVHATLFGAGYAARAADAARAALA